MSDEFHSTTNTEYVFLEDGSMPCPPSSNLSYLAKATEIDWLNDFMGLYSERVTYPEPAFYLDLKELGEMPGSTIPDLCTLNPDSPRQHISRRH